MLDLAIPVRNKHQARTLETQARILDAAQAAFAEKGFESTQLDEVADRAGYTRGAIYAHYASKEDLFLALIEKRVYSKFLAVYESIMKEPNRGKRLATFKRWIIAQVFDPAWGTLMLEFKLYALRRPSSRKKLRHVHELLFQTVSEDFVELLFGDHLTKASREVVERRMAMMGAVLSAVILESHFRPELFTGNRLRLSIEELFDVLVRS